jgi:hypothetical protein
MNVLKTTPFQPFSCKKGLSAQAGLPPDVERISP